MFLIDISTPLAIVAALALTVCVLFLSKEVKNSAFTAVLLGAFVALLVVHTIQLMTLSEAYLHLSSTLAKCLTVDFVFILLSYLSYLWVDDIETKFKNKKSIDNSLDWFWKKI